MRVRAAIVIVGGAVLACGNARDPGPVQATGARDQALVACTGCHGNAAQGNAAPPRDVRGETATTAPGVGAHQVHLQGGPIRQAIACSECHVVPHTIQDPGHIAGNRATLVWGTLATARGVAASYDPTAHTCTNYCHGAAFPPSAGAQHAPEWTRVDGSQAGCGRCHGIPPGGTHPAVAGSITGCSVCHGATVRPDGTIDVAGGKHVNGAVDVSGGGSCTACHGDAARTPSAIAPAPPRDTKGNLDASAPGVGAHLAHLTDGAMRAALACTDCHTVPGDMTHASQPLQLTWGPLAGARGADASFDPASLTCTNYCHGVTLAGGTTTRPTWTGGAAQAGCGACHGIPPGGAHPAVSGGIVACSPCHGATVLPDGTIDIIGGKHVNGTADVSGGGGSCTACHGDATRTPSAIAPAPPRDTKGNVDASAPGVGAHQAHLTDGAVRAALACNDCHTVPGDMTHASQPLQLTWGTLATAGGADASFDPASLSCANYCHGATLAGGTTTRPTWTGGASQAGCGTCHGVPPAGAHPAVSGGIAGCSPCHGATVLPDGTIDIVGGKHVNGTVDVTGGGSCTACHGDATRTPSAIAPAPPRDTKGNVDTSAPGVGAHQAHLQGGALRTALACTDCHAVPGDMAHASQPLQLTWSPLAGGVSATFDTASLTCSNYCHGATLSGGTHTRPTWTGGTWQAGCGTCHGVPPGGAHPAVSGGIPGCSGCHGETVRADGTIDLAGGKHVNGAVEVSGGSCTSCHGDATRTPSAIAPAPPRDTKGNVDTSAPGVGAHQAHLQGGALRTALACTDCHTLPGDMTHASLPLQLTWSSLATARGAVATFDAASLTCSNYCHGATLGGGTNTHPTWTGGIWQAGCGTCHGIPPPGAHPAVSGGIAGCSGCHGATVRADGTIDLAGGKHVNGAVEVSGGSCTSCHGDATRTPSAIAPAPPRDTKGNVDTSAPGVGAHQAHLQGGALRTALACTDCHTVPGDAAHASLPLQLTWSSLATARGAVATFDAASLTCSNYCHGATLGGGTNTHPTWTGGIWQAGCGTCHGVPPSGAHPAVSGGIPGCSGCHGETIRADGTIDLAGGKHVNGAVEISGGSCTSCHGDATRTPSAIAPAPPRDTKGNVDTSAPGVGAHQAHLNAGALRTALACTDCHAVPGDMAHASQPLQLTWGSLATTGGVVPAFDAAALTCTNYCHGATLGGGTVTRPTWTGGASQSACGTCHGIPPPSGEHGFHAGLDCGACHLGYTRSTVNPAVHVDGIVEVGGSGTGITSWSGSGCAATCHGARAW